jgi:hypothetical protein
MSQKTPNRPDGWEQLDRSAKLAWCRSNKTIDWTIHKTCADHGLQHLWVRDFFSVSQTGACAHPDCVSRQISAFLHDGRCGRLLKFADRLCGRQALVDATIDSMLAQIKDGRPTILHAAGVRWIALAVLKGQRLQDMKDARTLELKEAIFDYLNDDVYNAVQSAVGLGDTRIFGGISSHNNASPIALMQSAELFYKLAADFGPHWLFYLTHEISIRDVAKIEGCKLDEVPEMLPKIRKWYLTNFGTPDLVVRSAL